jgi:hypothetical protein
MQRKEQETRWANLRGNYQLQRGSIEVPNERQSGQWTRKQKQGRPFGSLVAPYCCALTGLACDSFVMASWVSRQVLGSPAAARGNGSSRPAPANASCNRRLNLGRERRLQSTARVRAAAYCTYVRYLLSQKNVGGLFFFTKAGERVWNRSLSAFGVQGSKPSRCLFKRLASTARKVARSSNKQFSC